MIPELALQFGLVATLHDGVGKQGRPMEAFWMISDARTRKELGSWVPGTRSARIGTKHHTRLPAAPRKVLKLYAELLARASGIPQTPERVA